MHQRTQRPFTHADGDGITAAELFTAVAELPDGLPQRVPPSEGAAQPEESDHEPDEPDDEPDDVYPRPMTAAELGADGDDDTLTAELAEALRKIPACTHCGGRHDRACPRVRRLKFHPNGSLAEVEFWPDGKWPTVGIIWPHEIVGD